MAIYFWLDECRCRNYELPTNQIIRVQLLLAVGSLVSCTYSQSEGTRPKKLSSTIRNNSTLSKTNWKGDPNNNNSNYVSKVIPQLISCTYYTQV